MPENKQQLTLFKVRDLRKKDQFKIDDAYLNGYARMCKPNATAVYNSLCRHAEFNTQRAFPSQSLIAYQHDISINTVKRSLRILMSYNIILIEQEKMKGKFKNNIYTLLDKSEWKKIDTVDHQRATASRRPNTVGQITTTVKRATKDNKVFKDYKYKKDNKDTTGDFKSPVSKIKRKDFKIKREVYKQITDAYEKYKGIKLQEAEYGPVLQAIKTMIYSGRTKENIIDFMKLAARICKIINEDPDNPIAKKYIWFENWTCLTIKRKMPEFLAGHFRIKDDDIEIPDYAKPWQN